MADNLLRLTSKYDNPFEAAYNIVRGYSAFRQDDWNAFAKRGSHELESYINLMSDSKNLPSDFADKWNFDLLDADVRFSAMYNELYGDRKELIKREESFFNEKTGEEDKKTWEMTEYDYVNYLLEHRVEVEQQKILRQQNQQRKDNMNGFTKFWTGTLSVLGIEPLQGVAEILQDLISLTEGVYDGFEYMINKKGTFGDGFRDAFNTNEWGGSDWRFLDNVGMTSALLEFEKKYTDIRDLDGNYTTLGKYLGGVTYSLGKALPTMALNLISAGTVGAGTAAAANIAKAATVMYYTGMGAGEFREMASNPAFASVPTIKLLVNASVKTAVEFLIQQGVSKAFGPTQLDKLMWGQTVSKVAGISAKSAITRIVKDFVAEGTEEFLQQYSNWIVDRFFAISDEEFASNSEWTLQTAFDAFILGGLSTIGGNFISLNKSILSDAITGTDGRPKLNFLASWQFKNNLGDFAAEYNKIIKNKSLSDADRQQAVGQMYAIMRTVADVYGEIGEERFLAAEKMLKKMSTTTVYNQEMLKDFKTTTKEVIAPDSADMSKVKALIIMTQMQGMNEDALTKRLTDSKITEAVAIVEDKQDIDEALADMTDDEKNQIVETVKNVRKTNPNKKIVVTKDGIDVVDFNDTIFVPIKYATVDDGTDINKRIAEQKLFKTVADTPRFKPILQRIKGIYEVASGETHADMTSVIEHLFFNDSFFRIVLANANKDVYQFLSHLDNIADKVVSKSIQDDIYKKKISDAKIRMGIAVSQYVILQQEANYNDLTMLKERHIAFIKKHRWGKDLTNRVIHGKALDANDIALLKARVNSMPTTADKKADIRAGLGFNENWEKTSSDEIIRTSKMHELNRIYKGQFFSPYDNKTYLTEDSMLNTIFNEYLFEQGHDVKTFLDVDKVPFEIRAQILDEQMAFDEMTLLAFHQARFEQKTGDSLTFERNSMNEFIIRETSPSKVKGYKGYRDIRGKIKGGKNIGYERQFVNVKHGRDRLDSYISRRVDAATRGFLTLADIIKEPTLLTDKIKEAIERDERYGELTPQNAFLYLREKTLDDTGTTSIVIRADGTYTFVDIRPMIEILKSAEINGSLITSEGVNIKEFIKQLYLGDGRLNDIKVRLGRVDTIGGKQVYEGTSYNAKSNVITISREAIGDTKYLRFALLHEFEHAVQAENNLNGGLSQDWLDHTGLTRTEVQALIDDVKSHVPELFTGDESLVAIRDIVQKFVYDTSAESQAMGTEGSDIVDFYPTLVQHTDIGTKITMPWGTQYQLNNYTPALAELESYSQSKEYISDTLKEAYTSLYNTDAVDPNVIDDTDAIFVNRNDKGEINSFVTIQGNLIEEINTREDAQNLGIASKLLSAAEDYIFQMYNEVMLQPFGDEDLHNWYLKRGYRPEPDFEEGGYYVKSKPSNIQSLETPEQNVLSENEFQKLVPLHWNMFSDFKGNDVGFEYLAWITPEQVFESKGQDISEQRAIRHSINKQGKNTEYSKGDFKINRFKALEVELGKNNKGEIDGSHRASIAQKNGISRLPIIIRFENEQHDMIPKKITFKGPSGKDITLEAIPRVPKYVKELTEEFNPRKQSYENLQSLETPEQPGPKRTRVTQKKIQEYPVLKAFKGKLLSNDLQRLAIEASEDYGRISNPLLDIIHDGTMNYQTIADIIRSGTKINDYTFNLINKYIYHNDYIKTQKELDQFLTISPAAYFSLREVLKSKDAIDLLLARYDTSEFMELFESLDENLIIKKAMLKLQETYEYDNGKALPPPDPGRMRIAFMQVYDGSIEQAGAIARLLRKSATAGVTSSGKDVKTTKSGLTTNISDTTEAFESKISEMTRDEKEDAIRQYRLEMVKRKQPDITIEQIKNFNNQMTKTFKSASDDSIDQYFVEHVLAEILDKPDDVTQDMDKSTPTIIRKLESIQKNIRRMASKIVTDYLSDKEFSRLPENIKFLFNEKKKLKQSVYDTRRLLDKEASEEATRRAGEPRQVWKQAGVTREQLLELEATLKKLSHDARMGAFRNKTQAQIVKDLEKWKKKYTSEKSKRIAAESNVTAKIVERVVVLGGHEFDINSDIELPNTLKTVIDTTFDEFSRAETQFLTGISELKISIDRLNDEKALGLTSKDVDTLVDRLTYRVIKGKPEPTQTEFVTALRNEKADGRFKHLTDEDAKDIYNFFIENTKEKIVKGDRNVKMNLTKFYEVNDKNLNSWSQADVDSIVEYYTNSMVGITTAGRDAIRRYYAYELYVLTFILEQNRLNRWNLTTEQIKGINETIETLTSLGGTINAVWRATMGKVDPNKVILQSIERKSGIVLRDEDLEAVSKAMKDNDLKAVVAAQNSMLRNAMVDNASGIKDKIAVLENRNTKKYVMTQTEIDILKSLREELEETQKELKKLRESLAKAKTKDEKKLVKDKIRVLQIRIEGSTSKSIWSKIWRFQRLAMLSGPGTWVRNFVSNSLVTIGNNISSLIGNIFVKKHRIAGQYKIAGTKVSDTTKKFIQKNLYDNGFVNGIIDGLSKYDTRKIRSLKTNVDIATDMIAKAVEQKLLNQSQLSRNVKLNKALKIIPNFIMKMLSDDPFIKRRTKSYLGKMLTEDKVDLTKGVSQEVLATLSEAFIASCFDYMRKANFFNKIDSTIKEKGGEAAYFAYKQFMPFASASWNWFKEGLNYTPMGLVKAIIDFTKLENTISNIDAKRIKGEDVMSSRFSEYLVRRNIGKGAIGSVGLVIGILLGVFGKASIDEEDEKLKLRVGNISVDISGIFGTQSIMLGMMMTNPRKGNWVDVAIDVLETMAHDSIMSDLFNSFRYTDSVGQFLLEQPNRSLGMALPNFFKTFTSLLYTHKVEYTAGQLGRFQRSFVQAIPGLAFAMPKKYDPYTGEVQTRFKIPRVIDAINRLTPIGLSDANMSDQEKEAVLYGVKKSELTGDYDDIGKLSPKDKGKLNKKYGELNTTSLKELQSGSKKYRVQNEDGKYVDLTYSQMTAEQKKRVTERIMSENAFYAKIFVYTSNGGKYYASSNEYKMLQNLGIRTNVYKESKKLQGFI